MIFFFWKNDSLFIVVILNHKNSTFNSLHTIVGAHFRQRCWGEKSLASALFTQRPKHLAVISFFGWPLGHFALSQSLMNNEHFGFKKSKNSGANSEAAPRRWVKQKLQGHEMRQETSVDFYFMWSHLYYSYVKDIYFLHCCRRTVEIPASCGIFVRAAWSIVECAWSALGRTGLLVADMLLFSHNSVIRLRVVTVSLTHTKGCSRVERVIISTATPCWSFQCRSKSMLEFHLFLYF